MLQLLKTGSKKARFENNENNETLELGQLGQLDETLSVLGCAQKDCSRDQGALFRLLHQGSKALES